MEKLRKDILDVLAKAEMGGGSFEHYCKTFFNRCSKGNKCIMFGIKNKELLTEIFGNSYPNLINDTVHYLVRIETTAKTAQDSKVQITFRNPSSVDGYTNEQKEWFRALYSHYNADKNVNLTERFSKNRKIDTLTLDKSDWADEFMNNPNENFRCLDGDGLIEKVQFTCLKGAEVELYNSLDDVFIIPEKYSMFMEYKKTLQQDIEPQQKESTGFVTSIIGNLMNIGTFDIEREKNNADFWKNFSENVCDVDKINFAILNHSDDFMVLTFFNLIERYRKQYDNINLLKRIFFVYDETAKTTKATSSEDLPQNTIKLFMELHNSLRKIETNDCDCALYVCALEFLEEKLDNTTKQKNEKNISAIKKLLFRDLKNNLLK